MSTLNPMNMVANSAIFGSLTHPTDPDITLWLVMVNSILARKWLDLVPAGQRALAEITADTYGDDMAADAWKFAGDPVRFDKRGALIDGQHRMTALAEADTEEIFVVITGLESDTMRVIDAGRKRTYGDTLAMRVPPVPSHQAVAALIRALWYWEHGCYGRRGTSYVHDNQYSSAKPSNFALDSVYDDLLNRGQDPVAAVREVSNTRASIATPCSPAALSLAYMLFTNIDPYKRDEFFNDLRGNSDRTSPNYGPNRLRAKMVSAGRGRQRFSSAEWLYMIIVSWNAFITNRELTSLTVLPFDASPGAWVMPIVPEKQ